MLIIPACGLYMPPSVKSLINAMTPALLAFEDYSCDNSSLIRDVFDECKIGQAEDELKWIGLESGSTLMNTLLVTILLVLLVLIHLVI